MREKREQEKENSENSEAPKRNRKKRMIHLREIVIHMRELGAYSPPNPWVDSKDFALTKVFLSVWWSGSKQR